MTSPKGALNAEGPSSTDAMNPVADDMACYRCDYSLRGLDAGGLSPECGGPIDESVARHAARLRGGVVPLTASDPRWVRRLAWGCGMLVAAAIGLAVQQVVTLPGNRPPVALAVIGFVIPFLLLPAGVWLATAPEPLVRPRRRSTRFAARVGIALWVAWFVAVLGSGMARHIDLMLSLMRYGSAGTGCLTAVFFWHLRPLAARLAARRLRRLATVLACLTLGAGVGRCVIGLHSIEVEPDTFLTTVPQPVVDDPMLVGAAANSLVKTTRRLDRDLAIDGASSALTLACVTALTLFGVALARAGREAEAPPEPRNA